MLSPVRAERGEFVAEIALLGLSPSALRNEKMQAGRDTLTYPVLTLPNEIVSEIFFNFLPVYPLCPPLVGILSPTILTQICRHWRAIAIEMSILWRAMSFSGRDSSSSSGWTFETILARELQISSTWIDRSRHHPLSIVVDMRCWLVDEIFAAIVPHRARWEHIKFHIAAYDLPTLVGLMPLLRHLDLSVENPLVSPFEILDVPRLRTAVLSDFGNSDVTLPWAQLTRLTLDNVERIEYLHILRQAPNLCQCELTIAFNWGDNSNPRHEIMLPRLESLTMKEGYDHMNMARIPDILLVPALRYLQIPEFFLGQDPIDTLRSFVSTAGCTLQSLHITSRNTITRQSFREAFRGVEVSFDDRHPKRDPNESGGAEVQ
ncbi:hypothetical protein DFH06DRAFT_572288 [Mycena polygramma]|nr:hypothetical protein DFH06DRAFT_572288 [Mycena polygramma]